ncbi:Rho-GAP domain-containing protein [Mycena venus]|uniref:Rho-GAP domain-containing protein n=1 Tax=Mycena venus TaxID=2733690 RepID=A0A8H6YDP1_9AGAR|nr:Rho-GAP domain-containing protein [Mycena venus]
MFFARNSPPTDPYTPLPKAPRGRATSDATRLRSASVSFVPEQAPHTDKTSKRHTYHALQSVGTTAARNRVMSLPSADEAYGRGRALQSTRSAHKISSGENTPLGPRRLENSDPRTLLRTLNTLLDPKSQRIPDFLDVDHLMALHERDLMEREQRDAIKLKARSDRAHGGVVCSGLTVFGSSLREATMFASNSTVLGGYEHDLPIVVFRCVQELCRHGFHPPRQPKPDRDRLLALISAFDSEPQFGATTPLFGPYELREVYALLTTYLFALPEPILSSEMFEAIWTWCVLPSLRSTHFLEDDNRVSRQAPTDAGIHIAQLLLLLLPLPNFSLVVYMMGFFQRLPHMVTEDVGRAVFAGSCAKSNASDGRAERAETMLRWLLDRWDAIKELLSPLEPQQAGVIAATESSWSPVESPPAAQVTGMDAEFTPIGGSEPSRAPLMRLPSDGLFEKAIGTESDTSSISSSAALGERLLDVTLEFAKDAQRDEKRWNNSHASTMMRLPPPQAPEEREMTHTQALRRISLLERELERSDVAVGEAISETFKAREQVKELEAKLRVYEKRPPVLELTLDKRAADDWHAVLQADTEALKWQLAEAQKERDAALQVVEEIKTLVRSRGCSL